MCDSIAIIKLDPRRPKPDEGPPAHHVGSPPTSFQNPWPSYGNTTNLQAFRTRFFPNPQKNYVPIPADRSLLPQIHKPNFNSGEQGLKATWFGHASFLIEMGSSDGEEGGMKVLCDPVWSQKVGPYGMLGPDRFTEVPCTVEELPEVDAVVISHDHYDHLDSTTLSKLLVKQPNVKFLCGLNMGAVLVGLGIGIREEQIVEMDWWDRVLLKKAEGTREMELVCTPAQHKSGRSPFGPGAFWRTLWCSWIIKDVSANEKDDGKKVFFAGDTGYCTVDSDAQFSQESSPRPPCPAFSDIGEIYGPFDLALLPIGCYSPRTLMSGVHSSPEDSLSIHNDIKSKRSIGMHYGTFRGSISAHYEPVTEPPERWRAAAVKNGLKWRGDDEQEWEVGICGIGETIVV